MKSYEEMTQAVITRVKEERQIRKRRRSNTLKATLCVCSLCLIFFGSTKLLVQETPESTRVLNQTPRTGFVLVSAAAHVAPTKLLKDLTVPCKSEIRVRDVTDYSKEEWEIAWEEAKVSGKEVMENSEADDWSMHFGSDTAIISVISDGRLELVVDDIDTVEDTQVTTTEMGVVNLGAAKYYEGDDSIIVFWRPSDAAIKQIEEDPNIKLSTLSFTLTVTVKFKDGIKETAIIDINVDEDGSVYAVQRSITVTG